MYRVIPRNHLTVKLHTVELLKPYLANNPVKPVLQEDLKCSLLFSKDPLPLNLQLSADAYTATIKGAEIWYDTYTNSKSLVVLLDSDDLHQRRSYLIDTYSIEDVYPSVYRPHVTLQYNVMENHQKYRWFYNEVLEVFNTRMVGTKLTLQEEFVTTSSMYVSDSTLHTKDTPNTESNNTGITVPIR